MLLFLLIFFLNFDGIITAKFNESLLVDKLYQNLLRVNSVLKDIQQKKLNISMLKEENNKLRKQDKKDNYDNIRNMQMFTMAKKNQNSKYQQNFSPRSPQYDQRSIRPTKSDRRQGLTRRFPPPAPRFKAPQLLVVPRPPSGYRMALVPIRNGPRILPSKLLLGPMDSRLHPPRFFSDYRFQNIYLRPPSPYLAQPLFTPTPGELNQSHLEAEINSFHQELPQMFNPFHLPLPPHFIQPSESGISPAVTASSSNGEGEKIWLPGAFNLYGSVFGERKNASTDQAPPHSSEITIVNTTPYYSSYFTEPTTPGTSRTVPANDVQLFVEDERGFLHVNVPQNGETTVPAPDYSKNWESTTAGDVLYGKIKVQDPPPVLPTQRYLELVERLDEGYMLVFMLELCRLIAVKNPKDVRQALYHTETIYNHLWNNGRLSWIEEPFQTVIWKVVILISEGDIEVVRTYASMMFHMLLRRRETLSSEVNAILEKADLFYNDAEGEKLFTALMEFENYPNTTKSSYSLCEGLVQSFLNPFQRGRHYRMRRRKKLLESINDALKTRFPRVQAESFEVKHEGILHHKKRKRKRHHYPFKMMRKKHRLNHNFIDGRQDHPNMASNYGNSILRSVPPTTKAQLKFRASPSRSNGIKTTSSLTFSVTNRPIRVYSFNKRNKKMTYYITAPIQEILDDSFDRNNDRSSKKTGHHHYVGQTSTARYKLSPRLTTSSTSSVFLRSSSPIHFKRVRKDKMHYHQVKAMSEESPATKKNVREHLRAGLLRKISVFPNMLPTAASLTGRS